MQASLCSSDAHAVVLPLSPSDPQDLSGIPVIVRYGILGLICLLSFAIRLFAVVRYESVIHEFDPYFNFRTTKVEEGWGGGEGRRGGGAGGGGGGKRSDRKRRAGKARAWRVSVFDLSHA
jgi:hypothetical protein